MYDQIFFFNNLSISISFLIALLFSIYTYLFTCLYRAPTERNRNQVFELTFALFQNSIVRRTIIVQILIALVFTALISLLRFPRDSELIGGLEIAKKSFILDQCPIIIIIIII